MQERQPPIDVSPSLPPSLKTIKTFKKERKEGRKEKEGVEKYLKESWPFFSKFDENSTQRPKKFNSSTQWDRRPPASQAAL